MAATATPQKTWGGRLVILIPHLWLGLFFLLPFAIVLKISLSATAIAQPPYTPVFEPSAGWAGFKDFIGELSLDNYASLLSDRLYLNSYLRSLEIAALATLMLLMLGYPVAYGMAR